MKFSDTVCKCAIASGAIVPPCEPADPPLTWPVVGLVVLTGAAAWALLAWLATAIWWLA